MSKIKIDKGIEQTYLGSGKKKYPWEKMEVGDSFLMPKGLAQSSCYGCARDQNRTEILNGSEKRFKGGVAKDGLRIWRIK